MAARPPRRTDGSRPPASAGGFTLIEILIVVVIFAIMALLAYGGLNRILNQKQQLETRVERVEDLQRTYMRMRTDLQNLANRPIRDTYGDTRSAVVGETGVSLEFTRGGWPNPLSLPRSTFERASYSIEDGKLYRSSFRVLDLGADTTAIRMQLLDRVTEMGLRFLDENMQWSEKWPADGLSQSATAALGPPRAIEVTLATKDLGNIIWLFQTGTDDTSSSTNSSSNSSSTTSSSSSSS